MSMESIRSEYDTCAQIQKMIDVLEQMAGQVRELNISIASYEKTLTALNDRVKRLEKADSRHDPE